MSSTTFAYRTGFDFSLALRGIVAGLKLEARIYPIDASPEYLAASHFNRFSLWFLGLNHFTLETAWHRENLTKLVDLFQNLQIELERLERGAALDAEARARIIQIMDNTLPRLNAFVSFVKTEIMSANHYFILLSVLALLV